MRIVGLDTGFDMVARTASLKCLKPVRRTLVKVKRRGKVKGMKRGR